MKPNYIKAVVEAMKRQRVPMRADGGDVDGVGVVPFNSDHPEMRSEEGSMPPTVSLPQLRSLFSRVQNREDGGPIEGMNLGPIYAGPSNAAPVASYQPASGPLYSSASELPPGQAIQMKDGAPQVVQRDLAAERDSDLQSAIAKAGQSYYNSPDPGTQEPQEEPMVTMVSPGGSSPSKWVERVSPQAKDAYKKAFNAQEATIRQNAGDKEIAALDEGVQAGLASQEMRDRSAQEEARANAVEQEAKQKIETERARIDDISKENAADSYDKNRFWSNMSTPRKIGLSLSTFLSGFVSGATGRQNKTLEYLDKLVDQDIRQQMDALNARRAMRGEQIASAKTAIELAQRQFPTAEAQRSAAKASAMEAIKMDLTRQLANTRSVEERAKGEEMLAALEGKRAEYVNQTMQFMQGSSSPALYRVKGKVGLYTGQQVDQQVQKDKELVLQYGDKSSETARKDREEARQESAADVVMPSGKSIKVYDPAYRDKIRTASGRATELINTAEEIKQIIGNSPTFRPDQVEKIEALQNRMVGIMGEMYGGGVLQEKEFTRFRGMVGGDINRLWWGNAIKAMDTVQASATGAVDAMASSIAQPGGQPTQSRGASRMPEGAVRAGGGR
jgi:hypothetical protein